MALSSAHNLDDESRRRLTIGFNNFAHAVDHYVMLIFPTAGSPTAGAAAT